MSLLMGRGGSTVNVGRIWTVGRTLGGLGPTISTPYHPISIPLASRHHRSHPFPGRHRAVSPVVVLFARTPGPLPLTCWLA